MQFIALALVILLLHAVSPRDGSSARELMSDGVPIEQIYPEDWIHELLTHPLRVSIFTPQPNGAIQLGVHHFSDVPHSLTEEQTELASKTFRSTKSYQVNNAEKGAPAPNFLLRFENEQQTVDFAINLGSPDFHTYINGQHHPESSSPKVLLTPAALKSLNTLTTQVIPNQ